jgi:hypothetical protein
MVHVVWKDDKIYLALDKGLKIGTYTDDWGKVFHTVGRDVVPAPMLQPLNVNGILDAVFKDAADYEIKRTMSEVYDKLFRLVGDYDTNYSPHYGSIGELTNKAYYREAYNSLLDEVKELLPGIDEMYGDRFFHGASFNHSILGGSMFRRQFHQYTPSDIISTLTSTMKQQYVHLKSHVEYMNMFFDKSFSINNGELSKFSDQAIFDALKDSDEYRLVALINDPKKGAKVIDLDPQNVGDIKNARELNAVLMSYQTYSKAFGAINSFSMRHSKLNWLHKINYLYKAGYLMSPGAMLRNLVDSVSKNYVAAADDPTGMTHAYITAWQLYHQYRTAAQELIAFSHDPVLGRAKITAETTKNYFDSISTMSKEMYDFVHGFDVDGPSGGQITEFEQYFQHGAEYGNYGMVIQAINAMMEPNKMIEQISRLAEYIWSIEKGMTSTKAYALIAKTHFDYAIKTDMQRLTELLFPFYTFTMNNIEFWMDAFDRVPALGSVLRDDVSLVWGRILRHLN